MKSKSLGGWMGMAAVILLAVALDQGSKGWYLLHPEWHGRALTDFLNLILVYNRGISFGWYAGENFPPWVWILPGLILCGVLVVWSASMPGYFRMGVALITGGALGNMIDRLIHGAVIDFLDLHWRGWHWPTFNLADVAITLGGVIVLATLVFYSPKPD